MGGTPSLACAFNASAVALRVAAGEAAVIDGARGSDETLGSGASRKRAETHPLARADLVSVRLDECERGGSCEGRDYMGTLLGQRPECVALLTAEHDLGAARSYSARGSQGRTALPAVVVTKQRTPEHVEGNSGGDGIPR